MRFNYRNQANGKFKILLIFNKNNLNISYVNNFNV